MQTDYSKLLRSYKCFTCFCRILLAAHTNVAVDRVLIGLAESGCTGDSGC